MPNGAYLNKFFISAAHPLNTSVNLRDLGELFLNNIGNSRVVSHSNRVNFSQNQSDSNWRDGTKSQPYQIDRIFDYKTFWMFFMPLIYAASTLSESEGGLASLKL